ncbi:MAG: helix-turn-helix transcriptional regulator, partial [Firmicutes bacterium]|nr:helix-turn-helix transcriptional regulator [Bacillota bacterium]
MDNPKIKTLNEVVVIRLLHYMEKQNLTQYKLAQMSNLPPSTVKSVMQRRTKGINLKTIIMLADGLGITPSEF